MVSDDSTASTQPLAVTSPSSSMSPPDCAVARGHLAAATARSRALFMPLAPNTVTSPVSSKIDRTSGEESNNLSSNELGISSRAPSTPLVSPSLESDDEGSLSTAQIPDRLVVPAAVTFTQFDKLPLELRTMIVKVANEEPQTVTVTHAVIPTNVVRRKASPEIRRNPKAVCKVSSAPPSLLHVNRECRKITLDSHKVVHPDFIRTPFYFQANVDGLSIASIGCGRAMLDTGDSETWSELGVHTLSLSMSPELDIEFYKKLGRCRSRLEDRVYFRDTWKYIMQTLHHFVMPTYIARDTMKAMGQSCRFVLIRDIATTNSAEEVAKWLLTFVGSHQVMDIS
ncbi:hypothetical protein PZA11_003546 [Diplocarpon coronariae]